MSTTVRISRDGHARLLRLQETWHRQRGDRLAQSDLVDRALEYAERHSDAFIDEVAWRPWTAQEIEHFFATLPTFDGPVDLSSDIDGWVYGREPEA